MNKKPMVAFLLSFIPGAGHLYLNRKRGFLYGIFAFLPLLFCFFLALTNPYDQAAFAIMGVALAFGVGFISMLDMIVYLIRTSQHTNNTNQTQDGQQVTTVSGDSERFYTILLSFIPGLGHFHLGLMNRGLTFLIGFFGLGIMIVFITAITNQGGFIVFLGILPIIWIYSMFDSIQQLNRKQKGEELVDRTIIEDFEDTRLEQGKKSKALATILAMFPGAGHMYLGLQRRGLQLMAAFLFSIYILDILRLSLFLFLIPLIWFYSFFDALQKVSKHGEEDLEDIPLVSYFINHQRWIGIGLLVMGVYYLFDHVVMPVIGPSFMNYFGIDLSYWYYNYFQTSIICILLIGGGLKLIIGSKTRKESA